MDTEGTTALEPAVARPTKDRAKPAVAAAFNLCDGKPHRRAREKPLKPLTRRSRKSLALGT